MGCVVCGDLKREANILVKGGERKTSNEVNLPLTLK
jgi:hypothetical protein